MSQLLSHFLSVTKNNIYLGQYENLVGMVKHWPIAEVDDGLQWWDAVRLRWAMPLMIPALDDRFGASLWAAGQGATRPLYQVFHVANPAPSSMTSSDEKGVQHDAYRLAVAQCAPDVAWQDPVVETKLLRWLASRLPSSNWSSSTSELISMVFDHLRCDVNIQIEEAPLGSLLRHPDHMRAWVRAGGDLKARGWDAQHPTLQAWEVLSERAPDLREALAEVVPEMEFDQVHKAQEDAYWKAMISAGKLTRDERWEKLTTDPKWPTYRSPSGRLPALLYAIQHSPGVLPILIKEARRDPSWREYLKVRDEYGAGIWETLLRQCGSPSVNEAVCAAIAQWVPPSQEISLLYQCLKTDGKLDRQGHVYSQGKRPPVLTHVTEGAWLGGESEQALIANGLKLGYWSWSTVERMVSVFPVWGKITPVLRGECLIRSINLFVSRSANSRPSSALVFEIPECYAGELPSSLSFAQRWSAQVDHWANLLDKKAIKPPASYLLFVNEIQDQLRSQARQEELSSLKTEPVSPRVRSRPRG